MAWQNPKTDWVVNPKNPMAEDFNRIERNIDFLKDDIETKKGLIVSAINDMNQPASIANTHAQLAGKIRDISKDANATSGDILSGKTAYAGGAKLTGTMPNRGAINNTITTQGGQITVPEGYHNGSGIVKAQFNNLIPSNVKSGINIGGVVGTHDSHLERAILNALRLPSLPVGVSSISGRFKTIYDTSGYIYAPSGKTWVLHSPASVAALSTYITPNKGYSVSSIKAYPITVLEIDLPSIYIDDTYDFGSNSYLVPAAGTKSSSYASQLSYDSGTFYYSSDSGLLNLPLILTGDISAVRIKYIAINIGGGITRTTYSGNDKDYYLGRIPSNQQWLVAWGSDNYSNSFEMYVDDTKLGTSGTFLFQPGKSLRFIGSGSKDVAILKLQAGYY